MSDERLLVSDLSEEWLEDEAFKAAYDALSDEFAVATARMTQDHEAEPVADDGLSAPFRTE